MATTMAVWFLVFLANTSNGVVAGMAPTVSQAECAALAVSVRSNPLVSVTDTKCVLLEVDGRAFLAP